MAVPSGGVDLGTFGQLEGTIPGMQAAMKTLSRGPEWAHLAGGFSSQPGKDFNDNPTQWLAGSSSGTPTYGPPGGLFGARGEL
jgi:hypothetical protein